MTLIVSLERRRSIPLTNGGNASPILRKRNTMHLSPRMPGRAYPQLRGAGINTYLVRFMIKKMQYYQT